jgi:hypothetical protein
MAVSIAQYVDLLFKKLQGVAKTANSTVKGASNESIASPPLLRGDVVWMQADQISNTAQTISGVTTSYTGTNSVECVADTTVPPIGSIRPTWLTNTTYWVPQEFGSTWLPKVFVGPSGAANIESTGTQIFAAGIGGSGEYYFDTQAGVLNFIGETIPSVLTVGNVVYISGYTYSGLIGVTNLPANVNIGNLNITDTTISTVNANANIIIQTNGTGTLQLDSTESFTIPVGNTIQRPSAPMVGAVRFNTTSSTLEVWDGSEWDAATGGTSAITNQTITPDGSTSTYPLDQSATADSILVSMNGVSQTPTIDYTVTGNAISFTTTPLDTDIVQVRFIASTATVIGIQNGNSVVQIANSNGNATVTINGVANVATFASSGVFVNSLSAVANLALPTYTVATANALSGISTGQVIYVSDGDSGSPCIAVYSGSAWKRISLGATIST